MPSRDSKPELLLRMMLLPPALPLPLLAPMLLLTPKLLLTGVAATAM
jgi:hypothetical protein